jgi:hypothetical protein
MKKKYFISNFLLYVSQLLFVIFQKEMYFLSCTLIILLSVSYSLQYDFVEPDQIEYPGDEYITLFPIFVSLNYTLSKDAVKINQERLVD